jgi:glycosyltransferase involved in cell wall biosynthesis
VAYRQPERTFVSDLLADLPDGESEFSDRYMLFEGFRQMPPVPVSHARIRSEGGGRYSIWGRRAHFSTTRFIRGAIDGNWIVEKSAANSSLLQFAPRIVERRPQIESFIAALGQWVTQVSKPAERTPTSTDGPLVLVTDALRPGGAERQWCYLAVELRRRGYRVYFVVVSGLDGESGHYLPMLRDRDVPVLDLRRESVLQAFEDLPPDPASRQIAADTANPFQQKLPALVVLLRRLAPRAVLAQLDGPNLLAGAAALLAGVPQVLFSFRNYNPSHFPYLRNDWYLPMYQALLGSSRVRLCGNARLANEDYARWLGIAPARIAFVTNAIDPRRFEEPLPVRLAALRAALGLTAGTPVILGVFRLNEEKRPLFFIDVCAALAQRIPGLRVFIAGVGPEEAAMRKRIRELQMAPVIDMIGRRDDIQDLMALASVLLLTSTLEGMPNVVMEAQTLGVPVVATHVGGVADCLIDGKTGRLVSPDDFSSYVEYTYAILADPELRSTLGLAAAAHARNLFSPSLVADRYLELIDDQRAVDAVSNANKPVMGTAVDRRFP